MDRLMRQWKDVWTKRDGEMHTLLEGMDTKTRFCVYYAIWGTLRYIGKKCRSTTHFCVRRLRQVTSKYGKIFFWKLQIYGDVCLISRSLPLKLNCPIDYFFQWIMLHFVRYVSTQKIGPLGHQNQHVAAWNSLKILICFVVPLRELGFRKFDSSSWVDGTMFRYLAMRFSMDSDSFSQPYRYMHLFCIKRF